MSELFVWTIFVAVFFAGTAYRYHAELKEVRMFISGAESSLGKKLYAVNMLKHAFKIGVKPPTISDYLRGRKLNPFSDSDVFKRRKLLLTFAPFAFIAIPLFLTSPYSDMQDGIPLYIIAYSNLIIMIASGIALFIMADTVIPALLAATRGYEEATQEQIKLISQGLSPDGDAFPNDETEGQTSRTWKTANTWMLLGTLLLIAIAIYASR